MEVFKVLDILVRGLFIPCIWIFIIYSVPGLKEDLQKYVKMLFAAPKPKRAKRKTVTVQTMPVVTYANSFSKVTNYSDSIIVSQH